MNLDFSPADIEKFLETTELLISHKEAKVAETLLKIQHKIPIFKGIDPLELKAILYNFKIKKLRRGEFLLKEGDESKEVYHIFNGIFEVFKGKKKISTLKAGDTFGEIAAIFGTPRTASVGCSSEEAMVLSFEIDQENFDFCAEAIAKIYKNLAYEINEKLQKLNAEITK